MFNKDRIIELIEEKGWTPYRLCKKAKMTQSTLSDILTGKRLNPTAATLQKIATALGVTVDEFFKSESISNEQIEEFDKTIDTEKLVTEANDIENKLVVIENKDLTKRNLRQIEKELEEMMQEIKSNPDEGFSSFDGEIDYDEEDMELLEDAFRTALRVVKKLNKQTYTPKKYR